MKKINVILIAALVLLNVYLFTVITNLESKIDTTDNLVINNSINSYTTEITEACKGVDEFVVSIKTIDSTGTGFIYLEKDGFVYIVTAAHLVNNQQSATVEFNNYRKVSASVIGVNENVDVAVLKAETDFKVVTAKLSKTDIVNVGETVIATSAANNSNYSTLKTSGIVSSDLYFDIVNGSVNAYIVSDATAANGFSGGPLINLSSEVIGMVVMKSSSNSQTFCVTADEIKIVADEIIENGTAFKFELGIKFTPVNKLETYQKSSFGLSADTLNGLYVNDVTTLGSGFVLGIKTGDVILSINDISVNNLADYLKAIYSVDDSVSIKVLRDNAELNLGVALEVQDD